MKLFAALASLLLLPTLVSAADIVPAGAKVEELWNDGEFTEGVAVGPDGKIYFSDITKDSKPGRVMLFDPATKKTTVYCADSKKSNGLMFDRKGRLMAACGANYGAQGLCEIKPDGTVKTLVGKYEGKRFLAPNDIVILPNGTIYFTDPRYLGPEPLELDHMSVYRYDTDGSLHRATTNIQKPNGVVVSPDSKWLYVAETNNGSDGRDTNAKPGPVRMTLNRFRIKADGSLVNKKVLVNFGKELGTDGMTVDTDGNIYAAVRAASRPGVRVYSPEGKEIAYIKTPGLPTNVCFGRGKEANVLYITVDTGLYRVTLNAKGYHPATS